MNIFEENRIKMAKHLYGDGDPDLFNQFYQNYLSGDYTKPLLSPVDQVLKEFNLGEDFIKMLNSYTGSKDIDSLRDYAKTYISVFGGKKS